MGPGTLEQVLRPLSGHSDPNLLVGLQTSDDAAVYRIASDLAIVQTLDFIPPIVDDPVAYGEIAAANSLSDIFAMNGTVRLALCIAAFPENMPADVIEAIFTGAARKVEEAGGVIGGGHTVIDSEPKFGLSATGIVHPDRVWTKANARPGDTLFLTKPIGTGLITTALKNGAAAKADVLAALESMSTLNSYVQNAVQSFYVHACTDVSGFGLIGHAHELATKSQVRVEIDASKVPLLPGTPQYAGEGHISGGLDRNREYFSAQRLDFDSKVTELQRIILLDPQTSGGLLLAVDGADADNLAAKSANAGFKLAAIGRVRTGFGLHISA
jgi:selenide,water dikinase